MTSKLFLAGIMAAATITANAQATQTAQNAPENCRCEESFEWLKSTFEANDAGFGYIVERKGRAAYDLHNQMTLEKARATENPYECTALLGEWLRFFRRGHIGIQPLFRSAPAAPAAQNIQNAQPSEPEMWKGNIAAFEKQIAARQDVDYEGVWKMNDTYTLGLKAEGDGYTGFIISSNEEGWTQGQVRMKITREGDRWHTTYYTNARRAIRIGKPELIENRVLRLETGLILKRVNPALPSDPQIEGYVKFLTTREPYFEQLNPTTLYLRIPSFDVEYRAVIEKIISDNRDKLLSTENLIIDVRGNGGGGDGSWSELFSLLYTNPVWTHGVAFRSTPLNIEQYSEIMNIEGLDMSVRLQIAAMVDKMKARPGEFVPMDDTDVRVETLDTVHEYPRSVGIIVDGSCASTTEQFLLAAKQSRKVKLFGVTTRGALDASNILTADSPDGRYRLRYTSSLSSRIPGMAIDDIGLQPDFYLDKTIPAYKWVEFVSDALR
jgi:hypothetical protein